MTLRLPTCRRCRGPLRLGLDTVHCRPCRKQHADEARADRLAVKQSNFDAMAVGQLSMAA